MNSRQFPTRSSIQCNVSGFMLRPLIPLELSFVQGEKYGSTWIILYATVQFDQHYLLKVSIFLVCISGFFKIKSLVSIGVRTYFWVFNLITLTKCLILSQYHAVFNPITVKQFEIEDDDIIRVFVKLLLSGFFSNPRIFASI